MRYQTHSILLLALAAATVLCGSNIALAAGPTSVHQTGTIAIVGGKLLTVSHGVIENGTVIIQYGRIQAVGDPSSVKIPTDATIIDAKGLTVYPGLIDPDTTLGLTEVAADEESNDLSEPSDEIMPHMHVADAFHAETELIPVARLNGVTNAVVAPGTADSIAGQDIFIQLGGENRDEMIVGRDVALAMNYGAEQRRRGGRGGGGSFPSTRMGLITQLRQSLLDAQHYEAEQKAAEKKTDAKPGDDAKSGDKGPGKSDKRDLKLEALLPYLHGEKPVVIGVYEGYDIESIMKVAQEFHLKVILNHVTHSQEVLDEIAAYKVPVIVGPIYDFPRADERYDAVYTLPAELAKRGIKIAISSGEAGGPGGAHTVRNLPYSAGFAVAYGLPYDEALKAITLNVAEMFGFGDKLGSLDVGKLGNVVIANGDPLDVRTDVKQVFIEGVSQPMVSRQTKLRDEYSKP
ncbi:amidohydrolase family protein [Acidicapsa dinghuensis]|uniref:Amidohydrolase family protein n=1 Tax=Acidicapsa dinghuensis TaxID=2218256 RepID=A0ABW1EBV7_9BACT|nr:amidohydrolase family protein [Acidicapsa dinghuensis]